MPEPVNERGDRAARRAWIRDNHPDRGGDPAAFVEGLRGHTEPGPNPAGSSPVRAYRSRRITPLRWIRRWRNARRDGPRNLR